MAEWRFFPFAHTALKNLFSKPATTGYPFEPVKYPERMRGHVQIKIEDCISCGLCAEEYPDLFHLNGEGVAESVGQVPAGQEDQARQAAEACPVGVITIEN